MIRRVAVALCALSLPLSAAQPIQPVATPLPVATPVPAARVRSDAGPQPLAPVPPSLEPAALQQLVTESYRKATACARALDYDGAFKVAENFAQKAGPNASFYHELCGTIL